MNTARHILLVEDEPTLQRILGSVLTDAGHQVESVGTAEQALERLGELSAPEVDLVLSDKNLPAMNGLDLLEQLREDERRRQLVRGFVMVTGYPSRESALRALELQCDGYMVKPFRSLIHAVKRIEEVLAQSLAVTRDAARTAHLTRAGLMGEDVDLPEALGASVMLDDETRRRRVEGRLGALGVASVQPDRLTAHEGPRVLIAGRSEDLVAYRTRDPAAGLVLIDGGASFGAIVELMSAGGATLLEPVRLTADVGA